MTEAEVEEARMLVMMAEKVAKPLADKKYDGYMFEMNARKMIKVLRYIRHLERKDG